MVEKFKRILDEMRLANKEISLFAILKMDEISDRWSVIFSAPNLSNQVNQQQMFEYLVNLILKTLNEDEVKTIARVGVLPLENHLVESLLKYPTNFEIKESTPVNGNLVHQGYILAAKTDAPTTSL